MKDSDFMALALFYANFSRHSGTVALSLSLSLSLPCSLSSLIKRDVDISGAFIKRLLLVAVLLCVQREARVEA